MSDVCKDANEILVNPDLWRLHGFANDVIAEVERLRVENELAWDEAHKTEAWVVELQEKIERLRARLDERLDEDSVYRIYDEARAEVERLREAAEEVLEQDLSGETVLVSYAAYKKLDAALVIRK